MIVTFVSECEKNALKKSRRVLDSFAVRIGSRTWQTVITAEGLKAVKKLLRRSASKNSAVACHLVRSGGGELLWIVGNRRKFDRQGRVPVNTTEQQIINTEWENRWPALPLMKALVALAGLWHDFGKASTAFQAKLLAGGPKGDPLRHEWISLLFLRAFVGADDDAVWLQRLQEGIDSEALCGRVSVEFAQESCNRSPLVGLPPLARLVGWLILSHHRMALPKEETAKKQRESVLEMEEVLAKIRKEWGYENIFEGVAELSACFRFPQGLPTQSRKWQQAATKWAKRMEPLLPQLAEALENGSFRPVLHHCRLALMLADHNYSSQGADGKQWDDLKLYANSTFDGKKRVYKQKLSEHLIRVASLAATIIHNLTVLDGSNIDKLDRAHDLPALRKKSPDPRFRWQDKAVEQISAWRSSAGVEPNNFGFFAINMAGTGCGKTFANAKVMRALSPDGESLRYLLALGLRTLTLQTGREYRQRIGMDDEELAVLIGSRAVRDLFEAAQEGASGSASEEALLENDLDSEVFPVEDAFLSTLLETRKGRQMLYSPVLSYTIDHLMAATESTRGGRQILPALRLLSSDLVIDEVDDFDGKDLVAIARLVHLAGMLGRKVMLSSATLPPAVAEGFYNAYAAGWKLFTAFSGHSGQIGCAWIDENRTVVESLGGGGMARFAELHNSFVEARLRYLRRKASQRRALLVRCEREAIDEAGLKAGWFATILKAGLAMHEAHCTVDEKSGKRVSFGVVRLANINPCIELTRFLLEAVLPEDTALRTMTYHSGQLLALRSAQENHLDAVLKRGDGSACENELVRSHLETCEEENVVFLLVASPVEEVGRDHDFDWAVVEPSSLRSLIQLAGRVMRHRVMQGDAPNVAILQYNLRGLLEGQGGTRRPAFCRPGYETSENLLASHDLSDLVDLSALAERLDAAPRITRNKKLAPTCSLADLEHYVLQTLLTDAGRLGPESLQGWLDGYWWLTAVPQALVRFRESQEVKQVFLLVEEGEETFKEPDNSGGEINVETRYGIHRAPDLTPEQEERLWMKRDYPVLLEELAERFTGGNLRFAALRYGELLLPTYGKEEGNLVFYYSHQLGVWRGAWPGRE